MQFENVYIDPNQTPTKKYIYFTFHNYHFYTILFRTDLESEWIMLDIIHKSDGKNKGLCPLCQKESAEFYTTNCMYFEDKLKIVHHQLFNHPALRLRLLSET